MRLALLLLALPLAAQTNPSALTPQSTQPAVTPAPASGTFIATYASFIPQLSPKPTGGFIVGTQTKVGGGVLWSVTGEDFTFIKGAVVPTAWTTFSMPLTTPWNTRVFLLAAPGASTSTATTATGTSTSTSLSFNGGIVAEIPRPKNKFLNVIVPTLVGPAVIKAVSSQVFVRVAWGLMAK